MLQISWTAKKSNKTEYYEKLTQQDQTFINRIPKHQATFFGHVMRRAKLEHLAITEMEGNRSREKQCEKILGGLIKWLKVGRVTEALKAMRDAWKVMLFMLKSMELE